MPPAVRALLLLLLLLLLLVGGSVSSAGAFALMMKLICEGARGRERAKDVRASWRQHRQAASRTVFKTLNPKL